MLTRRHRLRKPCDRRRGVTLVETAVVLNLFLLLMFGIMEYGRFVMQGQLLINAIQSNDLPLVQSLTFIFAVLIVFFNLIADVLYGILDPRIRYD